MIQMQSKIYVADNSGARKIQCIKVLGGSKRRFASIGDIIIVSIKDAIPRGKVKKGEIEPLPRKQSLEEMTENLLICPTNEMIDKLNVYAEAGIDEIIISAGFGQSQNEMIESMHRISEEVIPYFKKSSSQVA